MPKHSRIFRRFLISYLIILIIPSLAGYMSYRTSISVTESTSIENSLTQLQKTEEILEHRMAEVEGFTRQLALNQDLNVLMNEVSEGDRTNVYGIWKTMKDVLALNQTNDFLQDFYIYLDNYNVILTPGSAYFRPEHYYETFHYNDMTLEEWRSTILKKAHRSEIKPLTPFMSKGVQTSAITYMQSLPLDSFNDSLPATVVVVIDESLIGSFLTGLTNHYGGWAHISDADGHTICSEGISQEEIGKIASDAKFDKKKVSQFYNGDLVITVRSKSNGWVYKAGIPKQVIMENANKIKHITMSVTGTALLVGLMAGAVLSYRESVPLNRLLGVMKEQFGKDGAPGRNVYDFLQGNISDMITNNKRLEAELNRQLPIIRDAFLKRLVAGEFQSREEITAAAAQAGIRLVDGGGYAGILQINGYPDMDSVEILNELSAARLILKQALLDLELGDHIHVTDMGSDRIVTIFMCYTDETGAAFGMNEIGHVLELLIRHVFEEYKISATAAMGDSFALLTEINHSFEQARQALEYAGYAHKKEILWHSDTKMETTSYYYPLDIELRLVSTIRAGDADEAKRMVQSIMAQNRENRELSLDMKRHLAGELKGTLLKLLDQKTFLESELFESIKKRIMDIPETERLEWIESEVDEIVKILCGWITGKRNDVHAGTVEQIRQFIQDMYPDAELTLYRIAERVERPEKYISHLFKEVTGVNLSDYLEQVRMDHAAELLKQKEYTVDEIAGRVGYNSSHSFRRAFKRVMGIPPSSYRQSFN